MKAEWRSATGYGTNLSGDPWLGVKFGEKNRVKKILEIVETMSKVKIASAIAGGLVLFTIGTTNTTGYIAARTLRERGYSIEQRESMFWEEYQRANSFEKIFALAMRPGIRLEYMIE